MRYYSINAGDSQRAREWRQASEWAQHSQSCSARGARNLLSEVRDPGPECGGVESKKRIRPAKGSVGGRALAKRGGLAARRAGAGVAHMICLLCRKFNASGDGPTRQMTWIFSYRSRPTCTTMHGRVAPLAICLCRGADLHPMYLSQPYVCY